MSLFLLTYMALFLPANSEPDLEKLLAYYNFNNTHQDASGYGAHGVTAGPSFGPDRFGSDNEALLFSEEGSSIQTLSTPFTTFAALEHYSISFWVKTSSSYVGLLSLANAGQANDLLVWINTSGELTIYQNNAQYDSSVVINDDRWAHLCFTFDLTGRFSIYKDGVLADALSMSQRRLHVDDGGAIWGNDQDAVGGRFDSGQQFYGSLDELSIWDGALTSDQVNVLFVEGVDGNRLPLDRTTPLIIDEIRFRGGEASFAQEVISFQEGDNVGDDFDDPSGALGIPDYNADLDQGYVSLGAQGELVLYFEDLALKPSGDDRPDLWVFEIGGGESQSVAISEDGELWVDIGSVPGGTSGIDIDRTVSEGSFRYVKLTDELPETSSSPWGGADIDAVGIYTLTTSQADPPPSSPSFLTPDNFWWSGDGVLECLFPDPRSDGADGDLGYEVWLESGCENIGEPILIAPDSWPFLLTTPNLSSDVVIRIVRVIFDNGFVRQRSDVWTVSPSAPPTTAEEPPSRWLYHIPKAVGGFDGLFRFRNGHPTQAGAITLAAYHSTGNLLTTKRLTIDPLNAVYQPLYGDGGVFAGYEDQISHMGITDNVGNQSSVSLQIIGTKSGFGAWISEVNLRNGKATGQSFSMEARSDPAYLDGLAVLNLTGKSAVDVWAVQVTRDGETMGEVKLGSIEPQGKLLSVVSSAFPFVEDTTYRLETRNNNNQVQVLGMTFFEDSFFASAPVQRE